MQLDKLKLGLLLLKLNYSIKHAVLFLVDWFHFDYLYETTDSKNTLSCGTDHLFHEHEYKSAVLTFWKIVKCYDDTVEIYQVEKWFLRNKLWDCLKNNGEGQNGNIECKGTKNIVVSPKDALNSRSRLADIVSRLYSSLYIRLDLQRI